MKCNKCIHRKVCDQKGCVSQCSEFFDEELLSELLKEAEGLAELLNIYKDTNFETCKTLKSFLNKNV